MFSHLPLLSLTTVAFALSASDLKVSLTPVSHSVASVDDVVITAVVSNPTKNDISVITHNTILDQGSTSSFIVTKDNQDLTFTGVFVTIDPAVSGVYTTIPAGKSVAVNHTGLGALYDFAPAGTGTFNFAAKTTFQSSADAAPVKVNSQEVQVKITEDVSHKDLFSRSLAKRTSTPQCSNGSQRQTIVDALASARSLAGGAASDIRTHPSGPEYSSYFGGDNDDTIWYNMDRIAGDLSDRSGDRTISCSQDGDPANLCGANSGVIAYTYIFTQNGQIVQSNIYVCPIFFSETNPTPSICQTGYDSTLSSQGGVLLHELSHATAGTNDITYGCSASAGLSSGDKQNNADNYRCMGLAIYKDYNC